MLYPLAFQPRFKERVWGGRNLERLYAKALPPNRPIGESWEITDRPGDESIIANGPLAGQSLRWLMENHGPALLGRPILAGERFPLLVKILDAQETLSVQVHPPASVAARLGGEPKTEMWYLVDATPTAHLYAGLRPGTTRAEFEQRLREGSVAECIHRHNVKAGDAMFLPSGRIHAIGAGCVIFEIQQNSDTTYRVFDWNRVGLDGHPRELHLAESMASTHFEDFAPPLIGSIFSRNEVFSVRYLVADPLFHVDACKVKRGQRFHFRCGTWQILGLMQGRLEIRHPAGELILEPGGFALLPAALERVTLQAARAAEFLHVQPGADPAPPSAPPAQP